MANIKTIVGSLLFGLVGVILLPIIQAAVTDANFSGTVGTIMNNVPIMYALLILIGVVSGIYVGAKQ
jgi:uncharacterized membrane protein